MGETLRRQSIVIYSDDSSFRESIVGALGARISPDLGENDFHEFATADALRLYIDRKTHESKADLIILDAEAVPEGGMGVSRQLKDEVFECPPILLVTARADDAWLAVWSRADGRVMQPIDPYSFAQCAADVLRPRAMLTSESTSH